MATYTSPATWVAGQLVTAAQLNTHIRDNQLAISGTAGYIGANVYHSLDQSIASGGESALAFNSERLDSDPAGAVHDTVTNNSRLTIRTPGVYYVLFNATFAAFASGYCYARVRMNGTTSLFKSSELLAISGIERTMVGVTPAYSFAAADYVELLVYQNSGGAVNLLGTAPSPTFCLMKA